MPEEIESNIQDEERKARFINEHFSYEVLELLQSSLFILSVQARKKELSERGTYQFFLNMALEHTLLHARNLLEFFYYRGDKKKYAQAPAYILDWTPPSKTVNVKELETRVNDEITHLGWKRLDVELEDKSWKPLGVIGELLDLTDQFLLGLDQKLYGNGLRTLKDEMQKLRIKYHMDEVKPVLEYYDLFDAQTRFFNLS